MRNSVRMGFTDRCQRPTATEGVVEAALGVASGESPRRSVIDLETLDAD
jgi:hypothetical protein